MAETRREQLFRQSRVLRKTGPFASSDFDRELGPFMVSWRDYVNAPTPGDWVDRDITFARLLSLTVKRGREAAGEQPPPGTMTFGFVVKDPRELDDLRPGKRVRFWTQPMFSYFLHGQNGVYGRFNGYAAWVTDVDLTYQRQADGTMLPVCQVTAQGPRSRGAQVRIGGTPWPEQPAAERIWLDGIASRTVDALGGSNPETGGNAWLFFVREDGEAGDYLVRAMDPDRRAPDQLLDDLAADVGAVWGESLIWADRFFWQGMDARGDRAALVELNAAEVASTATWGRHLSGTVNRYTVEAGRDGDRTQVTVEDADSILTYGEFSVGRETELVDPAQAARVASLVVGRNSAPAWTITRLDVDLLDLKLPREKAIKLWEEGELGSVIVVTGLPQAAPTGRYFALEGTELVVTQHDIRLTIYVSDLARTGAPMTWGEVPAALTWDAVDPKLTWRQAAGWYEPPPTENLRWADVFSDQKWKHLAPGYDFDYGDERVPTWESYPDDPTP